MAALDTYGPFIFGAEHKRETDRIDPTEISPVDSEHSGSTKESQRINPLV